MGERFRLRKDFDVSGFPPHAQAILKGLKTYGMFVADNGSEWLMSIAPDRRLKGLETPEPGEGLGLRGGGDRRAVGRRGLALRAHAALHDRLRRARRELARPHPGPLRRDARRARSWPPAATSTRRAPSAIAQRFGFARAYTDVAAMLDAERPDAAVLAVPVHLTAAVGAPLLERGLPLLLEKPPGRTVPEVDRADRRRRTERPARPAPGRLQSALRSHRRGSTPPPRRPRAALHGPARPLRDDARGPARSRFLDDRDPRPRRRALPRGRGLRAGPIPLSRAARPRARRRQHLRGRGDDLGRHRAPGLLSDRGRGGGARHRPRRRPHVFPPHPHVGAAGFTRPSAARRPRPGGGRPRRRSSGRGGRGLRARAASTANTRRSSPTWPRAARRPRACASPGSRSRSRSACGAATRSSTHDRSMDPRSPVARLRGRPRARPDPRPGRMPGRSWARAAAAPCAVPPSAPTMRASWSKDAT